MIGRDEIEQVMDDWRAPRTPDDHLDRSIRVVERAGISHDALTDAIRADQRLSSQRELGAAFLCGVQLACTLVDPKRGQP